MVDVRRVTLPGVGVLHSFTTARRRRGRGRRAPHRLERPREPARGRTRRRGRDHHPARRGGGAHARRTPRRHAHRGVDRRARRASRRADRLGHGRRRRRDRRACDRRGARGIRRRPRGRGARRPRAPVARARLRRCVRRHDRRRRTPPRASRRCSARSARARARAETPRPDAPDDAAPAWVLALLARPRHRRGLRPAGQWQLERAVEQAVVEERPTEEVRPLADVASPTARPNRRRPDSASR